MLHHRDLNLLNLDASVITIGSFDGVHLGHQSIIEHVVTAAHEKNVPSVVITFYPHPSVVLRGRRPSFYITSPEARADRLGDLGVEHVVTMNFDQSLSLMKALDFLQWLKRHLQFQALWVGENFVFGHNRKGDIGYLKDVAKKLDFELSVVPPVFVDGEIISSTRVREALRSGDVARVRGYLGKSFVLRGFVGKGSGRGRQLGIPTANLTVWDELAYPGPGVYACKVEVDGKEYVTVVNIGIRPTFEDGLEEPLIEAHLINFSGDLYDEEIELVFIERLRDERRFNSPEELLEQIRRDIARAIRMMDQPVQTNFG